MGYQTCNVISFTLDQKASLDRAKPDSAWNTLFAHLISRGAFFTHNQKTEWTLNIPIRFPVGPFIKSLEEEDAVYWINGVVKQRGLVWQPME